MTELLNRPHAVSAAAAERVFGRSRLRMATGTHVDVFREASRPGERRRYTKRFLATPNGDYRRWTEREWRLLALLVGHGVVAVPEIVRFDRGGDGEPALIQTYDAGVTVDHWATLLPLRRGATALRHAFEDAPHWFALARHALAALDAVHALALVHLDLKADNVCIPAAPTGFDPHEGDGAVRLEVASLALIDFAFALVSGERLATALPIARQPDYDYQSPRLLAALEHGLRGDLGPTRELDWRCDFYSLGAMLERYLPAIAAPHAGDWTASALGEARRLVAELRVIHDGALPVLRPHARLIERLDTQLADPAWAGSLARGFTIDLAPGDAAAATDGRDAGDPGPTPVTRIAPALGPAPAPASESATAKDTGLPSAPDGSFGTMVGTRSEPGSGPGRMHREAADGGPAAAPTSPTGAPSTAADAGPADRHALSVDPEDAAAMGSLHLRPRADAGSRWRRPLVLAAVGALAVPVLAGAWWHLAQERDAQRARAALASAVVAAPVATPGRSIGVESSVAVDRPAVAAAVPASSPAAADARLPASPLQGLDTPAATIATAGTGTPAEAVASGAASAGADAALPAVSVAPAPAPAPAPSATGPRPSSTAVAAAAARAAPAARVPTATPPRIAARTPPSGAAPATQPRRTAVAAAAPRRGADVASTPPRPAAASPASTSVLARAHTAALAAAGRSATSATPSATPAPAAVGPVTPPPSVAAPRSSTDAAAPARPSGAQPTPAAPAARPDEAPAAPRSDADHGRRAAELLATELPRSAQRAERLVLRVLHVAGQGAGMADDAAVRQAARAIRLAPGEPVPGPRASAADARRLGDAARAALQRGAPLAEAVSWQTRAFGADPEDAGIAGTLAAWTLLQSPHEPQLARQLALHALMLHDPRHPQGRFEDWATFAIASSLAGRARESQGAWAVMLAVASATGQEGRACRAGLDAVARHGERLRAPVEAMLQRLHAGRGTTVGMAASPFCEWPPHWQAAVREPGFTRP